LAALLGTVGRVDPFRVAAVLPSAMAAAIGLAAGALVTTAGRRRAAPGRTAAQRTASGRTAATIAAVAVGVGTSVFVVRLINVEGYQDATVAAAVPVARPPAALLGTRRRPPPPAA